MTVPSHSTSPPVTSTLNRGFDRAMRSLYMVYQPIVGAVSHAMFGYEALVRTTEPNLSTPAALFAAAEKLDRLHDVGRAVRKAVAAGVGKLPAEAVIFVNLHSADLLDAQLYDAAGPLAPFADRVVFELTERSALAQVDALFERAAELRRRGYRVAIDDLGAGHAALRTLADVNPEVVKLDISLIRGINKDALRQTVVRSMVELARQIEAVVVAEGVETEAERDTAIALGCHLLQGFLFGRPHIEPEAPVW
jgi:EAL domain-containing protein (putative c-di-GMP-specific phosphodiesterase class I)